VLRACVLLCSSEYHPASLLLLLLLLALRGGRACAAGASHLRPLTARMPMLCCIFICDWEGGAALLATAHIAS